MNVRHALMGLALLVAAWLAFFAEREDDSLLATDRPAVQAPITARAPTPGAKPHAPDRDAPELLVLRDRAPMPRSEGPPEREVPLFLGRNWNPPPPKVVPAPPAPPQAPPVPYTYLGKQTQGGQWQVFLAVGDEVRVVRQGDALDGQYRITRVEPPLMHLTYLPLKQAQTLDIGASP